LRVSGPDSATFLQGQFTNDLRGLRAGAAVYGLWLTVKGKVVADSFVLAGENTATFWIGSYHADAVAIRERLDSHIIADDVTVEDQTGEWSAASLFWNAPSRPARHAGGDGILFSGRRAAEPNLEWIFRASDAAAARAQLAAARELDPDEIERRRILGRIPRVPEDIGPADLPNEGGLDATAVSFSKGCYLGQEVMARLKSMGQVRRKLMLVTGSASPVPTLPASVFAAGRQIGELRSAVSDESGGMVGLAMVSLLHVGAGSLLSLAPDATPGLRIVPAP
jgi:folate-binding protein YgfZ